MLFLSWIKRKILNQFFFNLVHLNLVNEEIIINAKSDIVLLVLAAAWPIYQAFSLVNGPVYKILHREIQYTIIFGKGQDLCSFLPMY